MPWSSKHASSLGWLITTVLIVLLAQLALAGAAMADGPDPKEPTLVEEPLSFVVDESLEPLSGQKGVATIADPHGDRSDFAANELIVVTDDEKALAGLLERRHGKLFGTYDPVEHGFDELRPRYLVRIDASEVDTERLTADMEALGVEARGKHRVSSREALGLIAVAAAEAVEGMTVGFNWQLQGSTIRTRTTTEAPLDDTSLSPGYTRDAYQWAHLANGTTQDTGIGEAWNLLARANRLPAAGAGVADRDPRQRLRPVRPGHARRVACAEHRRQHRSVLRGLRLSVPRLERDLDRPGTRRQRLRRGRGGGPGRAGDPAQHGREASSPSRAVCSRCRRGARASST